MNTLAILLVLMIIGALIAIEAPRLLSSIVSVGAVGFLLAIACLSLGAPDIAVTQLVVEILGLVILIRATIGRDVITVRSNREAFGRMVTIVAIVVMAVVGLHVLVDFPAFGESVLGRIEDAPSHFYLREGLARTGAPNTVTAILLDFRAYDTLGETTVLFCSVVGALAILRIKARKRQGEDDEEQDAI